MLSDWGVEFEPVNVHDNPPAQAEMRQRGIIGLPATLLDERFVLGWNPAALAELVGVEFDATPALSPRELAQTLDNILYTHQHLLKLLTPEQLALKHPERNRALHTLGFHVFRLSAAFVDTMEQGFLEKRWLDEPPPAHLAEGPALAAYGELVRRRLTAWFEAAPEGAFAGVARTYYGDQSVHALLERTTWHAGQHLRQVYDLLRLNGSLPVTPLAPEMFEGLPMPAELW